MKQEDRKALAARRRAFQAKQADEPALMEHSERVALEARKADAARKAQAGPPENKALDMGDLENKTKDELYELATEREIEGRSNMTKAELLKALR
ncbi:MAG: Rho termination factor N-terminal domain-containing protein [Gemmatimonadota bacterium]